MQEDGEKENIVSSGTRRNSEQMKESEGEHEPRKIRWNKKEAKGEKKRRKKIGKLVNGMKFYYTKGES